MKKTKKTNTKKEIKFVLKKFRNFSENTEVKFKTNEINLIFGENGVGKTNFSRYLKNCLQEKNGDNSCNECQNQPNSYIQKSKVAVFNKDYIHKHFLKDDAKFAMVIFENAEQKREIYNNQKNIEEKEEIFKRTKIDLINFFQENFLKKQDKGDIFFDKKIIKFKSILKKIIDYLSSWFKDKFKVTSSYRNIPFLIKGFLQPDFQKKEYPEEIIELNIQNLVHKKFKLSDFKISFATINEIIKNIFKKQKLLLKCNENENKILNEELIKDRDFVLWISDFVKKIYNKSKKIYNQTCPLCGSHNTLNQTRIKDLKKYYNRYKNKEQKKEIITIQDKNENLFMSLDEQIQKNKDFLFLKSKTIENNNLINDLREKIIKISRKKNMLNELAKSNKVLDDKKILQIKRDLKNIHSEYKNSFEKVFIVDNKTNFKNVVKEFFFKSKRIKELFCLMKKAEEMEKNIDSEKRKLDKEIKELKKDSKTPLKEINRKLNLFNLNIELELDDQAKIPIYKIKKKVNGKCIYLKNKDVSEGQKMIIGLLYFWINVESFIKNNSNIIAIDDPNSSLTEKNKFNIISLLCNNFAKIILNKNNLFFILSHDKSFLKDINRKLKCDTTIWKLTASTNSKFEKKTNNFLNSANDFDWIHLKNCVEKKEYVCIGNTIRRISERLKSLGFKLLEDGSLKYFLDASSHDNNLLDKIDTNTYVPNQIEKWAEEINKIAPQLYENKLRDIINLLKKQ